jgi:hypothetical protein
MCSRKWRDEVGELESDRVTVFTNHNKDFGFELQ